MPEIIVVILISLIFALTVVALILYYDRKLSTLKTLIEVEKVRSQEIARSQANEMFKEWTGSTLNELTKQLNESLRKEYDAKLESWKLEMEDSIRKDAIQRSLRTVSGKVSEEFSPLFLANTIGADMKDFRHLGSPIDYVVFRGLSDNPGDVSIIFLEIKSGRNNILVEREKRVKKAIDEKRVSYLIVNISDLLGTTSDG
ncbi:MAG: Holliday junction resolvase-like protein [Thermoplasmatales archaeon]